jgi:hypothetical protein
MTENCRVSAYALHDSGVHASHYTSSNESSLFIIKITYGPQTSSTNQDENMDVDTEYSRPPISPSHSEVKALSTTSSQSKSDMQYQDFQQTQEFVSDNEDDHVMKSSTQSGCWAKLASSDGQEFCLTL